MYRAPYVDWFVEPALHALNVLFHTINSATCFGTPHVPSSGSLCNCYHNALYGNVGIMLIVHVQVAIQPKFCDFAESL